MIYNNMQLHNVAELIDISEGLLLQRVPESLRIKLNPEAQRVSRRCGNVELRFVPLKNKISLKIAAVNKNISIGIFWGDFQSAMTFEIEPGKVQEIIINRTDKHWLSPKYLLRLPKSVQKHLRFSPEVCRIRLWGAGSACIASLPAPTDIRSPMTSELPENTILFYGTSITYGDRATAAHLNYANICARDLDCDLLNLGMPGAAFCEAEMADYIASLDCWDMAVLALSVNMIHFPLTEFMKRVYYMINTVASAHPGKNIFCVTLYPFHDDLVKELKGSAGHGKPDDYRKILRDAVNNSQHKNLKLIEGTEMLKDISGLGNDLIHPGDFGMFEIGKKLGEQIRILSRAPGAFVPQLTGFIPYCDLKKSKKALFDNYPPSVSHERGKNI